MLAKRLKSEAWRRSPAGFFAWRGRFCPADLGKESPHPSLQVAPPHPSPGVHGTPGSTFSHKGRRKDAPRRPPRMPPLSHKGRREGAGFGIRCLCRKLARRAAPIGIWWSQGPSSVSRRSRNAWIHLLPRGEKEGCSPPAAAHASPLPQGRREGARCGVRCLYRQAAGKLDIRPTPDRGVMSRHGLPSPLVGEGVSEADG